MSYNKFDEEDYWTPGQKLYHKPTEKLSRLWLGVCIAVGFDGMVIAYLLIKIFS